MSKVIMFANKKGGVGKTTSVFEVAYILSKQGSKVLMIDNDSQCNLTLICGAEPQRGKTVYDAIMGATPVGEAILNIRPNLDILAGNRKMLSQYFVGAEDNYLLKELIVCINEIKDYDYILIDVGPEGGQLMSMSLLASDYVIAVTSLASLGYSGVVQMCADIKNGRKHFVDFHVKPLGIVISGVKCTKVSIVNREKFEELAVEFEADMFKTEIKNSCIIEECKEWQQALNEYKPHCELANDYKKLVTEIKSRIKKGETV